MNNYPPHYAYPSAPPLVRVLPNPPRLHWGWVLALSIVTFGLFGAVWMFVQAIWVKKMSGHSKAFWWTLAYMLFIPAMFLMGIVIGVVALITHTPVETLTPFLDLLARLGGLLMYIFAAFTLSGELQREPIGIPLSGVMVFFFGAIYFQYHLWDYGVTGVDGSSKDSGLTQGLGLAGGPVAAIVPSETEAL